MERKAALLVVPFVENIYNALQNHDKVFIVFSAAHLLAERPTLEKLFE